MAYDTGAPILGLMLVRNENDVLEEVLEHHLRGVDHVFVLDGTTEGPERSRAICQGRDRVTYFTEDALPPEHPRPVRDGCRQFLMERARERFGHRGWFVWLHADELFVDRPADVVAACPPGLAAIEVRSLLCFVHRTQEPFRLDPGRSLREQIVWYAGPGWPEVRFLRNAPGLDLDLRQHQRLIPPGPQRVYRTRFKVLHYPYRDPAQQAARAHDRAEVTGFSPDTYRHVLAGRYYLDRDFFRHRHLYGWISRRPPRPRARMTALGRALQDLREYRWDVRYLWAEARGGRVREL
jgi:hypothetical protein